MILFADDDNLPDELSQFLEVLALPARREMVMRLLKLGELNATALGAGLTKKLSQPTVSRHLKVLTHSGLLDRRPVGAEGLFSINAARARRLGQQLIDLGQALTAGGDRHGEETHGTDRPAAAPPG